MDADGLPDPVATANDSGADAAHEVLPMVGIGASAGGIAAMQTFFAKMPAESGMAFVVILHLSPEHESTLAELLQNSTRMPVMQATDGRKVEANRVYVIPPGKQMAAVNGHLRLTNMGPARKPHLAVDFFFRSLADTHGPRAAAIVLSGANGDGAIGIKRIKERGGLTIAQDPDEAEHRGMPQAAIETGMVDWVLEVGQMPDRLLDYMERERRLKLPPEEGPQPAAVPQPVPDDAETALRDVLVFLRTRTGRDFSCYKRATILRRISRRMRVCGLEDMPGYLGYLRTHAGEAGALLQDLLISVTNFFRDRETFAALDPHLLELFKGKGPQDTVRVWVAGCATGEEAYSIAMLLSEQARLLDAPAQIQIFATDLDESAIRVARDGFYPDVIAADVSEQRLRRFFLKEHGGYRIRREVRDVVLFALHDVLKDSPFSRLDLICCRNLLIYLNREAQARIFDTFHFALRPEGRLFVGASESVEEGSPLFTVLDKKNRIYKFHPAPRAGLPVPMGPGALTLALEAHARQVAALPPGGQARQAGGPAVERDLSWSELHFKLVERLGPPSLVVSEKFEIMHISERAGQYLQFSAGVPSKNLLQAVQPMLRIEMRAALYRAVETHTPSEVIGVQVEIDGARQTVDIRVTPADDVAPGYLLVVFDAHKAGDAPAGAAPARIEPDAVIVHLEKELDQLKTQLRDSIEQHETSTEELKASNEELQAMNEELRSATEELETSREELQSINEEMTSVNQELKGKVDELGHANSDLHNLMAATAIATVFVDRELRIMRYTPPAVTLFNLIPGDLGRPLTDLKHRLDYPEMEQDVIRVLAELTPVEREVRAEGRSFLTRALPYRTSDDRIGGVVLTFVDITARKKAEGELRDTEAEQASDLAAMTRLQELSSRLHATETLPAVLDEILDAFIELQGADFGKVQLIGRETGKLEIASVRGLKPEYIDLLKQAETEETQPCEQAVRERRQVIVEDVSADPSFAPLRDVAALAGYRAMLAMPLYHLDGEPLGVLSVHFRQPHRPEKHAVQLAEIYARQAADVIAVKRSEQDLLQALDRAEAATRAKDHFLAVLSHELRTPLTPVLLTTHSLARRADLPLEVKEELAMIRRNVQIEARFIDDLLDLTRIAHGGVEILQEDIDVHEAITRAAEISAPDMEAKGQRFEMALEAGRRGVRGDMNRLEQVFWNLLKNASKFTPKGGEIFLRSHNEAERIVIVVTDGGIGMKPEVLQKIFHPFEQADESIARSFGGLGLGLAIARATVEAHGGEIGAASAGSGHGSSFTVSLPLLCGEPS